MSHFKGTFAMMVIAAMLVAGSAVAGDWQKLGKKTVVFGNAEDTSTISVKGISVSQIAFKTGGDWLRLTEVILTFDDGSSQTIEDLKGVKPGVISEGVAVDGGPKTLTSVEFSFQAASSGKQGRATVSALGQ